MERGLAVSQSGILVRMLTQRARKGLRHWRQLCLVAYGVEKLGKMELYLKGHGSKLEENNQNVVLVLYLEVDCFSSTANC